MGRCFLVENIEKTGAQIYYICTVKARHPKRSLQNGQKLNFLNHDPIFPAKDSDAVGSYNLVEVTSQTKRWYAIL